MQNNLLLIVYSYLVKLRTYIKKIFNFDFLKNEEPYEKMLFCTCIFNLFFHIEPSPCRLYHGCWNNQYIKNT